MLETSEERVKLLKAGFTSKDIERMYVKNNNLKIIRINTELEVGYTPESCTEVV